MGLSFCWIGRKNIVKNPALMMIQVMCLRVSQQVIAELIVPVNFLAFWVEAGHRPAVSHQTLIKGVFRCFLRVGNGNNDEDNDSDHKNKVAFFHVLLPDERRKAHFSPSFVFPAIRAQISLQNFIYPDVQTLQAN
jgi:hypothetical protein